MARHQVAGRGKLVAGLALATFGIAAVTGLKGLIIIAGAGWVFWLIFTGIWEILMKDESND
jgi:hypothetical protein